MERCSRGGWEEEGFEIVDRDMVFVNNAVATIGPSLWGGGSRMEVEFVEVAVLSVVEYVSDAGC